MYMNKISLNPQNTSSFMWVLTVFTSKPVADLGVGPRPPLLVEYLQMIYKKTTEMSIQKPF